MTRNHKSLSLDFIDFLVKKNLNELSEKKYGFEKMDNQKNNK